MAIDVARILRRWMMTDRSPAPVVVDGVQMQVRDVLLVYHTAGERLPTADQQGESPAIERLLLANNCVILPKKEFSKLIVHFGSPWTEEAQYKIKKANQKHVLILVYQGDIMSALKHVNATLGGQISFFSDDIKRFTGYKVVPNKDQITDHSRRCFVVGLDTVDRFINREFRLPSPGAL